MKYGILYPNKNVEYVDDNIERLKCTLDFIPGTDESDIKEFQDDEIEQSYDGTWWLKGFAPEKPQEQVLQEEMDSLIAYLTETDWYAIRYADSGVAIPDEIKTKRAEARTRIDEIRELLK